MAVNNYKEDEEKTKFSWSNLRRILIFVKPYKKEFILAIFLGIIASILLLLIPKIMVYAIDVAFLEKNFINIALCAFIILVLVLISTFITKIKSNKLDTILNRIAHDLKVAVFQKLQYLPSSYYDTRSLGKIYTRAATYPDEIAVIFCYVIVSVVLDIINLIFVLIFMLSTSFKLSIISIALAFILIIFFIVVAPFRRKLQHIVNDKKSNVNAYLSESIKGIRITQSFNREEKNENILKELEQTRIIATKKTLFIGNLNWTLTGIADNISMIIIYYIGLRYMYPLVSIGTIIAVVSYASRFWEPISYLTACYYDLMDVSVYLERIFELLDEDEVIYDSKNAKKIDIKGNIIFRDVSFSYDGENQILENLNFEIEQGQKIGIVGVTGSGKSTTLSLIPRFYDINEGTIKIDNYNIKDIKLKVLRSNVGTMLQDNFLFERSVYENLVLDKNIPLKEVIKICKMLDIHDMIMKLEKGYDTILYNNGSNLSSGEKQLLCIARISLQNPKILLFDEATSNVDLKTEKKIMKALDILMKDRTVIMVAHRISTVKNCDKIFLIKDKHVYESGTHTELMKKKGVYYNLYNSQSI